MKQLLLLLLCWFGSTLSLFSQSGSGWGLLLENDYPAARLAFHTALDQDSTDQQALLGLLYLSDIGRDSRLQEQLSRKLLRISGQEVHFQAFGGTDFDKADAAAIVADERLSEWVRYRFRYQLLRQQNKDYKVFADYQTAMAALYLPNDWHYLGPFKNIGGIGELTTYDPENELRNVSTTPYDNGLGKPLKWIQPKPQSPHGFIHPGEYLPKNAVCDLYYLHKRFSLTEDTSLYLSLGRNLPVKIWMDGMEIFHARDERRFGYDDERILLRLTAGYHDLRIKLSPYTSNTRPYSEFLFFELGSTPDEGICVRLTDAQGQQIAFPTQPLAEAGSLLAFETLSDPSLDFYQSKIRQEAFQWSDYYVYARLLMQKGAYQEGIDFFEVQRARKADAVYLRSLLAMFYGASGNVVQAYRSLEKVDLFQTPFYPLIFKEIQRVNPEMRSQEYQKWLGLLQDCSPSNQTVVRKTAEFYRMKNWQDSLDAYQSDILARYPDYKSLFKEEYSRTETDEAPFSWQNWRAEQKADKARKKFQKNPLENYESRLAQYPYRAQLYVDKARYLIQEEAWDDAQTTIEQGLRADPRGAALLELKGDWFLQREQPDSARYYFEQAVAYRGSRGYWRDDLGQKLKRLQAEHPAKAAFQEVRFADILAQSDTWEAQYAQEHVVVPLRTIQYFVDTNGYLEGRQKLLAQINTVNGVRNWTQKNFSFLGDNVSLKVIRPDGTEFRPEQNGNFAVFKDLRPGDRIYAEGTESDRFRWTDYPFNDHWMIWQDFMLDEPIFLTYLEIAVPSGTALPFVPNQLDQSPTIRTEAGYDFYRWELHQLPKLKAEEAGFPDWYAGPGLWLSNTTDWSKYVDWYHSLTFRKLEPNARLQSLYDELVAPGMTEQEKLIAFYTYITQEINYSSVPFLQSNFEPQAPDLTCTSGIGDCKDVATLMIALLRMAGIESYYALTLADQYLPFECLPQMIFNHVVVAYVIDGEMRYMDLTTDRFPWYALPQMDAEAWSLLIKPGVDRIFRLPDHRIDSTTNLIRYALAATIDSVGAVQMEVKGLYRGVEGAYFREVMTGSDADERDEFLRSELKVSAFSRPQYGEIDLSNMEEIHAPLELYTQLQAEDFAEQLYGLTLFQLPWVLDASLPDALLQEERWGSLDVAQLTSLAPNRQRLELTLPAGYRLYQQPEDVQLNTSFGTYTLQFSTSPTGLVVERYADYQESVIPAGQYAAFRDFYFQRHKHDRTKVVLVKE